MNINFNQRELDYVIEVNFVLIWIRYVSVLFHLSSFYAPISCTIVHSLNQLRS